MTRSVSSTTNTTFATTGGFGGGGSSGGMRLMLCLVTGGTGGPSPRAAVAVSSASSDVLLVDLLVRLLGLREVQVLSCSPRGDCYRQEIERSKPQTCTPAMPCCNLAPSGSQFIRLMPAPRADASCFIECAPDDGGATA